MKEQFITKVKFYDNYEIRKFVDNLRFNNVIYAIFNEGEPWYGNFIYIYHDINKKEIIEELKNLVKKKFIGFVFDNNYNFPLDNLPEGLEYLQLGDSFNHKINKLPSTIKILKLGKNFNKHINNLPLNLKYLVVNGIGYRFSLC